MYPTARSLNEALAQHRIDQLRHEAWLFSLDREARGPRGSRRTRRGSDRNAR